jgi:uncharacterized membrane protein YkvA (DUF1232 family)
LKGPRRLVSKPDTGFFAELGIQARLLWRLTKDSRVNPLAKLLPIGSFLYLLFPFDFFGPIDDALVIWLGSTLFIELSPPEVVEEHRAILEKIHKPNGSSVAPIEAADIIDADYSDNS